MRQLNIQLYGRTAQNDFNESLSTRKTITLTPEPTKVELSLKGPGREKLVELRLDPDDKPTTFTLHDLHVRSVDGRDLYRWDGSPDSLIGLVALRPMSTNDGVLMKSNSNDPFLLVPLPEPQAGPLLLELSVSQALASPGIHDADNAVEALGAHQQELADAVRSLQSSLRLALDDLASEQEGLQDTLVIQYAHSRSENDALRDHLSNSTRTVRNEILAEVREDWRSLKRQIEAGEAAQTRKAQDRADALAIAQEAELAKLMTLMRRFAAADETMKVVRAELGASHDADAITKLRELKAEAQKARDEVAALERSLCWRLLRPFNRRKEI